MLVDLRDSSLDRLIDVQEKLTSAVDRQLDIVRLADAEAEPALLAEAVADGRVLVDRVGLWPTLCRRESRLRRYGGEREAQRAQDALAAIDRLLTRAQNARTMIEHGYLQASAGDVHRAAEIVRESARDFIAAYRVWI